jgi:hypothetical protein
MPDDTNSFLGIKPAAESGADVPRKAGALREHEGSQCVKCGALFLSKVDKCSACQSIAQPVKWYSRLCVERLAFILVATVAASILGLFSTDSDTKLMAVAVVPALYVLGYQFMGVRLTERFAEGHVPPDASKGFSWARFFKEGMVLGGVIIAIGAAIALRALWRAASHS